MGVVHAWRFDCDYAACRQTIEFTVAKLSTASWKARDAGWQTGRWNDWYCPLHVSVAAALWPESEQHQDWCPWNTRHSYCACREGTVRPGGELVRLRTGDWRRDVDNVIVIAQHAELGEYL